MALIITLFLITTPLSLLSMMQQPTRMQQFGAWNANRKEENAINNANKGEATIEKDIADFKSFIQEKGYLELYTTALQEYNQNKKRESDFVSSLKASRAIKVPACIRMPEYRHMYRPLSEIIRSYREIKEVMEADANTAQLIFKSLDARCIGDLRDRLRSYDEKTKGNDTSAFSAEIDNLNDQLNAQRTGATLYMIHMGIEQREIINNINDMQDMAEDVESLLDQLDGDEFWKKMHREFVKRYTDNAIDANEHPYTFPVDYQSHYLDFELARLIPLFDQHAAQLKDIAHQIVEKASPYFTASSRPQEFDLLLRREQANKYCIDGYLGYWLQKLVDHYNEMVLSGLRFVGGRATLRNLLGRLAREVYQPLLESVPELKETTFKDPVNMTTYDPTTLTDIRNRFQNNQDIAKKISDMKSQYDIRSITYNIQAQSLILGNEALKRAHVLGKNAPTGVPELHALRRMLYSISIIFETLISGEFNSGNHMTDLFGDIPEDCIIRPAQSITAGNHA